ncbi:hypothetical protein AAFF_G00043630, partial [Aldrovandia affinis]
NRLPVLTTISVIPSPRPSCKKPAAESPVLIVLRAATAPNFFSSSSHKQATNGPFFQVLLVEKNLNMTVVLRLHGLNIEAGSEDIRQFFDGLQIPEGGVHITGGSRGEAFIIFATEKDGLFAMGRSGRVLRGSKVTLSISSKGELQHKMAARLKKYKSTKSCPENKMPKEFSEMCSPDQATALLLTLVTAIGLQAKQLGSNVAVKNVETKPDHSATPKEQPKRKRAVSPQSTCYLRLYGLPKSITKQDVCHFFNGLRVQEIIFNVRIGESYGCLVKFGEVQDASEGLKLNHHKMGSFYVQVKMASLEMWTSAIEQCKTSFNESQRNLSPPPMKRNPEGSRSRSPKRHQSHSLSHKNELCVKIENIPPTTSKTEIKGFFGCPDIQNNKILHLLNKQGYRTSTAFIMFDQMQDYCSALNLSGRQLYSNTIEVSPITKKNMVMMINGSKWLSATEKERGSSEPPRSEKQRERSYSHKTCIYVRNLPADVRKVEVKDLFCMYRVQEDCISLLYDRQGVGIGEALVKFLSEELAEMAEGLNGTIFLGTNVLLTCITREQMEDMLRKKH